MKTDNKIRQEDRDKLVQANKDEASSTLRLFNLMRKNGLNRGK